MKQNQIVAIFVTVLFSLSPDGQAQENAKIESEKYRDYSRKEIFSQPVSPEYKAIKYFAEPDLNGDGTNDLIISESVSLGGSGGLPYSLYLGKEDEMYQMIPIIIPHQISHRVEEDKFTPIVRENVPSSTFFASIMALEAETSSTPRKLWLYSHGSCCSGSLCYLYFDREDNLTQSGCIIIHSSVEGESTGAQIMNAIFGEENSKCIKTLKVEVPQKSYLISDMLDPANDSDKFIRIMIYPRDTLESIAEEFGISKELIMQANGLSSESKLEPGKTLLIPKSK